jgi:hypothetical protein
MNEESSTLADLISQMPDPDERGMYCTDINKEKIERAVAEIHRGGRKYLIAIIDMLVPPGQGNDVKAHYALHCLALHVCKLDDDRPRRRFARALASQLGGDRPKAVQRYLVQQLQVAGGKEVTGTLGKLLTDKELCEPAAQALVAIGDGAAEQLRDAMPKAGGKCRLTIVQNLGVVRDTRSVPALRQVRLRRSDEDRELRLAAVWGLANIGDSGSVDILLRAADTKDTYERTKATKACLLLAEKLLAAGEKNQAAKIYAHLRDTRNDSAEKYIRDVAERQLTACRAK